MSLLVIGLFLIPFIATKYRIVLLDRNLEIC